MTRNTEVNESHDKEPALNMSFVLRNLNFKCLYLSNISIESFFCVNLFSDIQRKKIHNFRIFNHFCNIITFASESDLCSSVVKQLKQLQGKPEKFWSSNGIQIHDATNWAMTTHWKQVKSEYNLYLLYEETEMMCTWYKSYIWTTDKE